MTERTRKILMGMPFYCIALMIVLIQLSNYGLIPKEIGQAIIDWIKFNAY